MLRALAWLACSLSVLLLPSCARRHEPAAATLGPRPDASRGTEPVAFVPADDSARFEVDEQGKRLILQRGPSVEVVLDLARHVPLDRFSDAKDSLERFSLLSIAKVGEFERDGVPEAVLWLWLGSACANTYLLVRAEPTKVSISKTFGECRGELRVVPEQKTDVFLVEGNWTRRRYTPRTGGILGGEETRLPVITATRELTLEDIRGGRQTIAIDLDGNGAQETIECSSGESIQCTITAADGSILGHLMGGSDRFGVLASSTLGHRDLVFDAQMVMRWNGRSYE